MLVSKQFERSELCYRIFFKNDKINKISYTDNIHRKLSGLRQLNVSNIMIIQTILEHVKEEYCEKEL